MVRLILLFTIYLFVNGCGSDQTAIVTADTIASSLQTSVAFTPGIVQARTASDGSRFQLYLPSQLDTAKSVGIVVFLDPHANGHLPLTHYKRLADSLGLVFVGSDVSGNGVAVETIATHLAAVKAELQQLFHIDNKRYYLCGFSGGARAAAALAAENNASGVILCSAAPGQPLPPSIAVAGVSGMGDMNYLEMRSWFTRAPVHDLYLFGGTHSWPPAQVLEMAIESVMITSGAGTTAIADRYLALVNQQIDSLRINDCDLAMQLSSSAKQCLASFPAQQNQLTQGKAGQSVDITCVTKHLTKRKAIEEKERMLQNEIQETVFAKDPAWWTANAPRLFTAPAGSGEEMMRKRVQGYASLLCYSYATRAMKSNNPNGTDKLITTYSIVDPENSEWAYLRACLDARLGMPDLAFEALQKAAALGFRDKQRAEKEADLAGLKNDQRWVSFMTTISN